MKKFWFISLLAMAVVCGCDDENDNGNGNGKPNNNSEKSCDQDGFVSCDGSCINPKISRDFCGADDSCQRYQKCSENQNCKDGKCVDSGSSADTPKCTTEGAVYCEGRCIDPKTEKFFCGADKNCENYKKCSESQTCDGGDCKDETCEDKGLITCQDTCINPQTDPYYCGAKAGCTGYNPCDENTQKCENGGCVTDETKIVRCDQPGQINCNNECVDPNTNTQYCGADDQCTGFEKCEANEECKNGACIVIGSCDEGLVCDKRCVNPQQDNTFCGATLEDCSDGTECVGDAVCIGGECKDPTLECNSPNIYCSAYKKCIDPMNDNEFCGIYSNCTGGQRCSTYGADYGCRNGECVRVVKCVHFQDSAMEEFAMLNWNFNHNSCFDTGDIEELTQAKFEETDQNLRLSCNNIVSIDDLNLLTNVTKLDKETFKGCKKIKKVNLTNITEMGSNVFEGCTSLTDVTIPNIKTLPDRAFKDCTNLENATFDKVNKFETTPFEGCTDLDKLSLITPDAISITKGVFNDLDDEAEKKRTKKVTLTLNRNKEKDVEVHGIYGFRTFLWNGKYWWGVNYPK